MGKFRKPIPYIIKGRPVKVYSLPTSDSSVINALPPETKVIAIEEVEGYLRLYEDGGYILNNNNVVEDKQSIAISMIQEKIKEKKNKKLTEQTLNLISEDDGWGTTDPETAYLQEDAVPASPSQGTGSKATNTDGTDPKEKKSIWSNVWSTIGDFVSGKSIINLMGYDPDMDASHFKVTNSRSVFGFPYQFEPTVDNRLDGSMDAEAFGRKFSQKIVSRAPVMIMQAGVPDFLKGFSDEEQKSMLGGLFGDDKSTADQIANQAGKYYAFKDASIEYFTAVTDMCRSVGAMMGIGNKTISVNGTTGSVFNFDWLNSAAGNGGSHSFWGYYRNAVAFYVSAEPQMQDSFTNGSRQSQLANKVNQLSDQAAELNFILGGVEGFTGLNVQRDQDDAAKSAGSNGAGVLGTLMDRIDTLMSGGRLIFPEIWSDSSYTKNYNVTIKLDSPDCDPLSIYLNIFVPLCHIIGFCMPRWSAPNAYVSPFIVRAYFKSMFHIDMGIITSCDITRGTQQGWTQDGLPTEVTVNLTIKDLYNTLSMVVSEGFNDLIGNPAQLDYLGNLCGINVAVPDFSRTITLWTASRNPTTALHDAILRRQSQIAGVINNRWQSLFNNYWRMGGSGRL